MKIYERIVQMNDEQVRYAMEHQVRQPGSRHDGGIANPHTGIPSPSHGGTAGFIAALAAALVVPESAYYRDQEVLKSLERAVQYMLNRQHDDGTISLGGTNFHSPPDTSFVVTGLCQVYRVLEKESRMAEEEATKQAGERRMAEVDAAKQESTSRMAEEEATKQASASYESSGESRAAQKGWEPLRSIVDKLHVFLERSIPALVTGGCHTPNHRWVMTAALSSLHEIFNRTELVERANRWLAEGMDCTEDGEWTERSNGIYNTVSDIMLYYTASLLNRPELLEHVRRNLRMMVYMVHHDGKVVTDYSDRQDFGLPHDLSEYFLSYRFMAAYDRDPLFASMYDLAGQTITRLGPVNNHALLGMLRFPCVIDELERMPLPERYEKLFNAKHPFDRHLAQIEQAGHQSRVLHSRLHTAFGAPVVRIREDRTSVTMMARTPSLFSLRHGEAKLHGVRVSTLFSPGIVHMDTLEPQDGGYRLSAMLEKGYNGPLAAEDLPDTSSQAISPWYLLPHHKRELTHVQTHKVTAVITRRAQEWNIRLCTDDLEDVLTQVVFLFASDCKLQGEGLEAHGQSLLLWKSGTLRCEAGKDWIEIEAGEHAHRLIATNGIDAPGPGVRAVAVNLLSPYDRTFRIRLSEMRQI